MNKLVLDGVVGWEFTAASVREALADMSEGDVTIQINSPGGSVVEGVAIYNAIREYARSSGYRIVSEVTGMAAYAQKTPTIPHAATASWRFISRNDFPNEA